MKHWFLPIFIFTLLCSISLHGTSQTDDTINITTDVTVVDTAAKSNDNVISNELNDLKAGMDDNKPNLNEVISVSKVIWSIIVLIIAFIIIRLVTRFLFYLAEKNKKQELAIKRNIPVIRIIFWVLVTYFIIKGIFNPPLSSLVAFFASIGVAVGFASQDILRNIFGGLVILFDKPFSVGDKVASGNHYGEVVEIGLRSTRILTSDDSLVSIPNGELMKQAISNSNSGENNCMVVAEFYLPINTDTEKARQIALEAARTSKYVFLNKPVSALFINEMKDTRPFLKMRLKAYVLDLNKEFAFKSEMTETVMRELIKAQIIRPEDLM